MNELEAAAAEKAFWDAFTFDVATNSWSLVAGLGPLELYERCIAKHAAIHRHLEVE